MQMADLVEITFPSEEKAEQVRQKLLDMQNEYLIELADAVIAVKQPNGRVKLNQLFNPTASGAVSGTFWGALFVLVRKMTTDKVLAALQGEGGTVIRTSFDESKEEALRAALAGATPSAAPPAS